VSGKKKDWQHLGITLLNSNTGIYFLAPSTINVAQTNNTTDVHLTSRQLLCIVN